LGGRDAGAGERNTRARATLDLSAARYWVSDEADECCRWALAEDVERNSFKYPRVQSRWRVRHMPRPSARAPRSICPEPLRMASRRKHQRGDIRSANQVAGPRKMDALTRVGSRWSVDAARIVFVAPSTATEEVAERLRYGASTRPHQQATSHRHSRERTIAARSRKAASPLCRHDGGGRGGRRAHSPRLNYGHIQTRHRSYVPPPRAHRPGGTGRDRPCVSLPRERPHAQVEREGDPPGHHRAEMPSVDGTSTRRAGTKSRNSILSRRSPGLSKLFRRMIEDYERQNDVRCRHRAERGRTSRDGEQFRVRRRRRRVGRDERPERPDRLRSTAQTGPRASRHIRSAAGKRSQGESVRSLGAIAKEGGLNRTIRTLSSDQITRGGLPPSVNETVESVGADPHFRHLINLTRRPHTELRKSNRKSTTCRKDVAAQGGIESVREPSGCVAMTESGRGAALLVTLSSRVQRQARTRTAMSVSVLAEGDRRADSSLALGIPLLFGLGSRPQFGREPTSLRRAWPGCDDHDGLRSDVFGGYLSTTSERRPNPVTRGGVGPQRR